MKTNSMEEALKAFMAANPDLPAGKEIIEETESKPKVGIKLNVTIEKKGHAGKTVTIVYGLEQLDDNEIESLARELKKKLGVGGSYRGDEILIQGDFRDKTVEFLRQKGFLVK